MVSTNARTPRNGNSLRFEPPPRHVHYNPEFVCLSSEAVLPGHPVGRRPLIRRYFSTLHIFYDVSQCPVGELQMKSE